MILSDGPFFIKIKDKFTLLNITCPCCLEAPTITGWFDGCYYFDCLKDCYQIAIESLPTGQVITSECMISIEINDEFYDINLDYYYNTTTVYKQIANRSKKDRLFRTPNILNAPIYKSSFNDIKKKN